MTDKKQINEISKNILKSYIKKSDKEKLKYDPNSDKAHMRDQGINLASTKIDKKNTEIAVDKLIDKSNKKLKESGYDTDLKTRIKHLIEKETKKISDKKDEKKPDKSKNPNVEFNPPEKTERDIDEAVAVKGASAQQYAIKSGDTLSQLAKTHGISVQDIMRKNPDITDPDSISAGKQISIPKADNDSNDPLTKTSPKIYDSGFGTDKGPVGGYSAALAKDKQARDDSFQTKNSTPPADDATAKPPTDDAIPKRSDSAIPTPSAVAATTPVSKPTATTPPMINVTPKPAIASAPTQDGAATAPAPSDDTYTDKLNGAFGGDTKSPASNTASTSKVAAAANTSPPPVANTSPKKIKTASNDDDDDVDESVSQKLINNVLYLETMTNSNKFQIAKTINEVSSKTLHSYIGKAMTDNSIKRKNMDDADREITNMPASATKFDKQDLSQKYTQNKNKSMQRSAGIDTALSKIKTKVMNNTEELFNDNELNHIETILNKE